MKLIVLGSSASYALPDEATAGYLIQEGGHSLALDMGTGCLSNLFRWQDPADLEALILSHLHVDHFADIYPLRLYLNFERPQKTLTVYAPDDAAKTLSCMLSERGKEIFERKLQFNEIAESEIQIGSFKIAFVKVVHDIDSYAVKVEANGKSLVYTSDTAYNDKLVQLAQDTDLLLSEATLEIPVAEVRHMTAADAGSLAKEAKAKKLVLTHIWPSFKNSESLEEASKHFQGHIDIAEVNKVFEI